MVDIIEENMQAIIESSEIKTFGFIIYNEENPSIVKLLRDDDYWNALNSISGEKFYIFSVKPKKGKTKLTTPSSKSGVMQMLIPVYEWQEPKYNKDLLKAFDINTTKELPLFFIFTKVDSYLLKQSIKINENNVETAFQQLKKIFYEIDELSNKINKNYQEHPAQVHDKFEKILSYSNFKKSSYTIDSFFSKTKKYLINIF